MYYKSYITFSVDSINWLFYYEIQMNKDIGKELTERESTWTIENC